MRARTSVRTRSSPLTDRLCCRSPGGAKERACGYCDTECTGDISLRDRPETVHDDEYFRYRESVDGGDCDARVVPPASDRIKVEEKKNRKIVRSYLNDGSSRIRCKSTRGGGLEPTATDDIGTEVDRDANGEEPHCEFSEQSNVEEFGPLPESVFEAIEDSQEYREVDHNFDENEIATNDNVVVLDVKAHRDPSPTEGASESHRSEAAVASGAGARDSKTGKIRKCPKCDKAYTASSSYFYHLKHSHNPTKEYECDVCGKRFGTKASLSAHGSLHTGDLRHACARCGSRFRTAAGLYIHEQTHSGIKSHGCSQCERSFRWRTHLRRHERRHRGERPHACATCARAFSERADLLRHARTHAAARLPCPRCADTFAQPRYLRVHVRRKHPGAPPAGPE